MNGVVKAEVGEKMIVCGRTARWRGKWLVIRKSCGVSTVGCIKI